MSELENSANSQKGLAKLLEVFRDSFLGIIKPSQLEKIALAQASAASIASTSAFKTTLKQNLANEISQMTHSAREARQFYNIANIYAHAAQEIQMIGHINDTPVSSEWSARFFDYAQDICEEEAQIIWGKILTEEVANPGKFFKRTLSILRNIEPFEAKWFVDICPFVLQNCFILSYIVIQNHYPANQFQSLIDCGLINSINCGFTLNENTMEIHGKTQSIKFILPQTGYMPQINMGNVYVLTDAGSQLYKITLCQTDQAYLIRLKEHIERTYNIESEFIQASQ